MITRPAKSTLTGLIQFILVSVVGITLIAVLLPVFTKTHNDSVHQVQSRMASLGQAMQEYCDDNDGLYPSGSYCYKDGPFKSLTGLGWAGQLYPYVRNSADFGDAMGEVAPNPARGSVVAFALNENAARNERLSTWTDRSKTVILYQVIGAYAKIDQRDEGECQGLGACSPSGNGTIIMLLDGLMQRLVVPATGDVGGRPMDFPKTDWPQAEIDGGSFYLLADGHVKWFKPESVSSGTDAITPDGSQTGGVTGRAAATGFNEYKATFSTK